MKESIVVAKKREEYINSINNLLSEEVSTTPYRSWKVKDLQFKLRKKVIYKMVWILKHMKVNTNIRNVAALFFQYVVGR